MDSFYLEDGDYEKWMNTPSPNRMPTDISHTIKHPGPYQGLTLVITDYNYTPGFAGVFGGPPDCWEPPEPPEIEILDYYIEEYPNNHRLLYWVKKLIERWDDEQEAMYNTVLEAIESSDSY